MEHFASLQEWRNTQKVEGQSCPVKIAIMVETKNNKLKETTSPCLNHPNGNSRQNNV